MTEAETAALDLIDAQQQMLVAMNDAGGEKDRMIASLNEQLAAFQQPSDAMQAIAERQEWFNAFRGVVAPAPAAPATEQPAEEQAAG